MRLWNSLHSIGVSVALLVGGLTSTALAVTTIPWTGDNNFNDEAIYFKAFKANELTDITGYGQYEGCCTNKTTNFSMYLLVSARQGQIRTLELALAADQSAVGQSPR